MTIDISYKNFKKLSKLMVRLELKLVIKKEGAEYRVVLIMGDFGK